VVRSNETGKPLSFSSSAISRAIGQPAEQRYAASLRAFRFCSLRILRVGDRSAVAADGCTGINARGFRSK
jgi:hypothetical protein